MPETPPQFTHGDYTVGWICALPETELVAAGAMLDDEHPVLAAADPKDTNSYLLGRIGTHNVVIACLPAEGTGKVNAATVASNMVRSFKAVRFGLMVGIGGGAPYYGAKDNTDEPNESKSDEDSEEDVEDIRDIRLGDVVISLPSKSSEAVVQYDFGKSVQERGFIHTGGKLNKPPNIALNAVSMLRGQHKGRGHKISEQLSKMVSKYPLMDPEFLYPGSAKDQLFKSKAVHPNGRKSCKACCGPLDVNLVKRESRPDDAPRLHYGTIGSADQVMKDATLRDKWAQEEKIVCFEMEASGNFSLTL
jgi:nucleoside phosphorylase